MSLVSAADGSSAAARDSKNGTVVSKTKSKNKGKKNTTTTTTVTTTSKYKKAGEQLSDEAIYRAKLKYGIYQMPSNGHTQNRMEDSNTAAQYAADNTIAIETYKRLFVDQNAAKAATALYSDKIQLTQVANPNDINCPDAKGSQNAATTAYSAKSVRKETMPHKERNSRYSIASASSVLSGSTDVAASTPRTNTTTLGGMNMSKLLKGAELKAGKLIEQRCEPPTEGAPIKLKFDGDLMTNLVKPRHKPQKGNKNINSDFKLASDAATAVKNKTPRDLAPSLYKQEEASMERKRQLLSQLTSEQVLSKARANTEYRLSVIDQTNVNWDRELYTNESYNKQAIDIATKRYNETRSPDTSHLIQLGGGLAMPKEEIHKIAQNLISPVLNEVNDRATSQRQLDVDIQERNRKHDQSYNDWRLLQTQKLANNSRIKNETRLKFQDWKQDAIQSAATKHQNMMDTKNAEIEKLTQEKSKLNEELKTFQSKMDTMIAEQHSKVELELANFQTTREEDLRIARKEQDDLLRPYYDDIEGIEMENKELLKERDSINSQIDELRESITRHKTQIETLTNNIAVQEELQLKEDDKLTRLGATKEELSQDLNNNAINIANKAKEEAELSKKQAHLKSLEVDAIINERKSELNRTQIELKRERLNLLETFGKLSELRGEDKLDESRIQELLGMSPEEYRQKIAREEGELASNNNIYTTEHIDSSNNTTSQETSSLAAPSASAKSIANVSGIMEPEHDHGDAAAAATSMRVSSPLARNEPITVTSTKSNNDGNQSKAILDDNTNEDSNNINNTTNNELKPTFSGFSQGSLPDHYDEDDQKNSFFKEVF